ncbi:hypothetical protein IJM16_00535 [Candidatus Saccharibacteria bacterium]|nr:hypothetical protein [Candidatus Saccharibacteria bacterium]
MHNKIRRYITITSILVVMVVLTFTPSIRGIYDSIARYISGITVHYYNNDLQNDGDDTNNYNFGFDRKAAADNAVGADQAVTWIANKDGTGDMFASAADDPSLCAALGLHIDQMLHLEGDQRILRDEADELIGQRADKAHLHFLRDHAYWERAVELIKKILTSGSIRIEYVNNIESQMYMMYNGLEGNKPSVIVRKTHSSNGYCVVFDLGKPGKLRFKLSCGYQPIDVDYWKPPTPVPPGPDPGPEPTPTLEPKQSDGGTQGQLKKKPPKESENFMGQDGQQSTTSTNENQLPDSYTAPPPPPAATPKPANTQKPSVPDLTTVQQTHSTETVETPLADDGVNQGDLNPDDVE